MKTEVETVIIGAGIIGLATAFHLAREGREVMLIDPRGAGGGTSFGNACTLAPYAVTPVGHPDIISSLPGLLFSADSPLAMRWSALPQLLPWLMRFARECTPGRTRANAAHIATLLKGAVPEWQQLAADAGVAQLFHTKGCLYAYHQPDPTVLTGWPARLRAAHGTQLEVLNEAEVAKLEPQLPPMKGGGIYFPDAKHIDDPATLTQTLMSAVVKRGGVLHQASVTGIAPLDDGRVRVEGNGFSVTARKVVLSAGAWSKPLAQRIGDDFPLETERGYHLEFACETPLLNRPVSPIEFGFYLTPLTGRLRAAGTVELGGLVAPQNEKRLAYIEKRVRAVFPQLGPVASTWLGFRPSLPDSLPVIGPSSKHPSVIYAFGHGHIGMTLGAITGRLVKEMIVGGKNSDEAAAFSPRRFTS
ncbi:NAD(P)/FAD-dependent oxidoreductase [Aestuariivirga litoralis]|uniref:NAD(P)/FAD-dependent oxidoreductase n=1 Tax=Aestuariivirga litoralis TaxID=2650924 RepID=UPI0018C6CC4B|nr:FAD-dependent oxidoreductase [Aestuariivirga litoralis]MBG1232404.1 FAD-binding oxidoreductase [Aestuariivirga litoralis]